VGHQVLDYPNGDDSKIPFQSRIGTKLIVGFLFIATITGSVGYLSLYYSQTVADKFHELVLESLPAIESLKEIKVAALHIETATNEYVFIPGNGYSSRRRLNSGLLRKHIRQIGNINHNY
jgi:hypothetical protein